VARSGHDPTISLSKTTKPSVRIFCVMGEIRIERVPRKNLGRYVISCRKRLLRQALGGVLHCRKRHM
jgi:hypothetical protein